LNREEADERMSLPYSGIETDTFLLNASANPVDLINIVRAEFGLLGISVNVPQDIRLIEESIYKTPVITNYCRKLL
jgi:hypothetical protein